jgi:hypothetical protein
MYVVQQFSLGASAAHTWRAFAASFGVHLTVVFVPQCRLSMVAADEVHQLSCFFSTRAPHILKWL